MKDDDGEILPLMTRRGIGGHISIVREQNSVWLGLRMSMCVTSCEITSQCMYNVY